HGHDPYAATYLHGPLASRPLGTKTHFPYLPGIVLFGLPRALVGDRPPADSRVWFALSAFAVAGVALTASRAPGQARLHSFLVLAVVPTGALLMATGGDDLPVLALLLLALVLAGRRRLVGAGIALGLAAATKQTAWVLVPFLVAAVAMTGGRRAAAKLAGIAAAVAVPLIGAFVVWNPGAFWEDAVRF